MTERSLYGVIGLSWMVSALLALRLWRGADGLVLKVGLTLVLLMPVVGPFFCLWIQAFPPPQRPELQDRLRSSDVLDRWRHYLEQSGRQVPLRRWNEKRKRRHR